MPSAVDARPSRSLYLSVTHTRTEPLTKARTHIVVSEKAIVLPGNRQAREATEPFILTQRECSHFIFSNTVCVTTLA